jgi:hypothetical protein
MSALYLGCYGTIRILAPQQQQGDISEAGFGRPTLSAPGTSPRVECDPATRRRQCATASHSEKARS